MPSWLLTLGRRLPKAAQNRISLNSTILNGKKNSATIKRRQMKRLPTNSLVISVILGSFNVIALGSTTFVGQDDWLFYVTDGYPAPALGVVQNIVSAAKAIEKTGTKVIITIVPLKSRIYEDKLPTNFSLTTKARNQYTNIISELRRNDISAVDINSSFLAARKLKSPQTLFFRNDTHWTPYGALVAAQAVAKYVKNMPILQNKRISEYTYSETEKVNNGDLVKFLWTDAQQQIQPEKFTDYQYKVIRNNISLLEDDSPTITLVGTSYSNNSTKFLGGLQYSLKTEIINFSVAGGMVEKPMSEYLKSDTYKQKKPDLIVWEIPESAMWSLLPDNWYRDQILENLHIK